MFTHPLLLLLLLLAGLLVWQLASDYKYTHSHYRSVARERAVVVIPRSPTAIVALFRKIRTQQPVCK